MSFGGLDGIANPDMIEAAIARRTQATIEKLRRRLLR
jgi:hypothetical protein